MVDVLFELYYQAMCHVQHFGYLSRLCANLLDCFNDFVMVQPRISTLYHKLQVLQLCVTTTTTTTYQCVRLTIMYSNIFNFWSVTRSKYV